MANFYYLETGSTDPFYNLAFEEFVLENRTLGSYLILWQNENTIVIGQNQNAEAEISRDFVEKHGIRLVRRMTGGGAVYHDLGNLNYSFVTDGSRPDDAKVFLSVVVDALCSLGLEAKASGRNDILAGGKKVSGTASRLHRGRLLFHGTLLFDSDLEKVAGALKADPAKFQGKGIRSVKSRVGNIRPLLSKDMDLQKFWNYLRTALSADGFEDDRLTEEELASVLSLRESKYAKDDWNWGPPVHTGFTNKKRYEGGTLEVMADIRGNRLHNVRFLGDYLALVPNKAICEALENCPLERGALEAVLSRFDTPFFFGSISADEVIDTLLRLEKK